MHIRKRVISVSHTAAYGVCFIITSAVYVYQFSHCNIFAPVLGGYPYATCFVCKKVGHISKDCPKNDHGLYPNGGCCLECGSVRHFKKDCPQHQRKQGKYCVYRVLPLLIRVTKYYLISVLPTCICITILY